jgi:hypothetical protein
MARGWAAKVKCAKVKISTNNAVGFVEGKGTGPTRDTSIKAAKKNANDWAGPGYRAKHCDVKSVGRR